MSARPAVGFVGVGLMGWGMAKNVVEKGYPLNVVAHRKREAVDDLVARGAVERASIAELAAASDVIALCVTGAPEVAAAVAAIKTAAKPGALVIDCSTSEPDVTRRLAGELAAVGIDMIDAPLSRTPAHAWSGELTTYVAGKPEAVARARPILETWATTIIETGAPVGAAHALKLVNNLVAIGFASLWSECYGAVEKLGLEPRLLHEIVSASGMNCGNFQNFSKYVLEGDANAHKFSIVNMVKDITYYQRLAQSAGAATTVSDGVRAVVERGVALGYGERFMPETVEVFRAHNRGDA